VDDGAGGKEPQQERYVHYRVATLMRDVLSVVANMPSWWVSGRPVVPLLAQSCLARRTTGFRIQKGVPRARELMVVPFTKQAAVTPEEFGCASSTMLH
jgi:hypothetical protein